MEKELFFHILGMEETKEEGEIRKAYRGKLKETNPEDNPEGFKRLRQAYEGAMAFAGEKKDKKGAAAGEVGRWMEKVDRLYHDLTGCQKPELWEELLSDPVCEGLDSALEAKERILDFLAEHIYLPHSIWMRIDHVFRITQDPENLKGKYPEDFLKIIKFYVKHENFPPYGLLRYRQGEREEANKDAYISGYLKAKQRIDNGETVGILKMLEELKVYNVYHPYEDVERMRVMAGQGKERECTAVMEQLCREYPDDWYIGTWAGELLWNTGEKEQAYQRWISVLEREPERYGAKYGAVRYLMENGQYDAAWEMITDLLEQDSYNEELNRWLHTSGEALIKEIRARLENGNPVDAAAARAQKFRLGWCLFGNERLAELEQLMEEMPDDWKEDYDYCNLYGKFLYCRERYEEAVPYLQKWLEWIESTEEGAGEEIKERGKYISAKSRANLNLGSCYAEMGRTKEAEYYIQRAAAATEDEAEKMEYRQHYAAILLKNGEYEKVVDACNAIIRESGEFYPAYVIRQEAYYKLGRAQEVVDDYWRAVDIYAGFYRPYLFAAEVFLDYGQYEDAMHVLERAGTNRIEFTAQMKLCEIRLLRGMAKTPGDRKEIRRRLTVLQQEWKEETYDLEDKSELEYEQGLLWWDDGQLKEALACMERAAEQNPERIQYRMACGELYWKMGKYEESLQNYMKGNPVRTTVKTQTGRLCMIIGIDLGTTNSLAAYFTEEGPKIIPNRLGKRLTPSVVSVDEEGQVYVGDSAVERGLLYPESTAGVFKRDMGSQKQYSLLHKTFTAEELSSFVLRALKEDAEHYLGEEVTEAVISVPAYFNDARRRATKRAGELAGLKVERIISEPTAAAIAYGLYQNKEHARFLVFDLGGGTFDVSILELYDTILEVRAVAGDNFLGGEDFTLILEDMFYEKFPQFDRLALDEKTRRHIHKQAEICKLGFSQDKVSGMHCKIGEEEFRFEVELTEYEEACEELFEKIRQPVKRSLSDAHIRLSDIDKVVLVGGATKSPVVRRFVSRLFRMLPDTNINPDEAVALGTAIQGAMKERRDSIKEVILTDVCPFTLGTEVVREWEKGYFENGVFCPIIDRNTVIPASRTERLYTVRDDQVKIRVKVLQGESRFASNNLLLGELEIDVPAGKAGEESVDVTYTYDINSILEVEVKVVSTQKQVKEVFVGQNVDMTEQEIQERLETLSYLKIHPRDREENKYLLLRGERIYEESLGERRMQVEAALHKYEQALNTYDSGEIEKAKGEFKKVLEELDEF